MRVVLIGLGLQLPEPKEKNIVYRGKLVTAMLSPCGVFMDKNKNKKLMDISHFHVSLAHAHSSALKATAQQHVIQEVGELVPCGRCSMAKGIRASTPHHTTSRTVAPMDMVQIDTAVCRHVRGQRFTHPAPVRRPGQERICHSRCGEKFRGRLGSPAPSKATRRSLITATVSEFAAN